MPTITRRFEFDAGHRVLKHESKCRRLHGHRYVVELTVRSEELDSLGRVVDFGVLKSIIGQWIDDCLDHNMLLHPDDPLIQAVKELNKLKPIEVESEAPIGWEDLIFGDRMPYIMPPESPNPTAENIAKLIFSESRKLLQRHKLSHIHVVEVVVHETPNCRSEYPDNI